jgi:PBP1b-binding outer membrane lipoprotein LpoB
MNMNKSIPCILVAIALLAGCKSVEVTKDEYAADGKTLAKRTFAKVNVIMMSTELEYVNILGLGSLRNYKTDGGEGSIKAAAEGAATGTVKALKGGAL